MNAVKIDHSITRYDRSKIIDDLIADIPTDKVYEWLKNGKWKKKDFDIWLKVIRVIG